MMGPPKVTESKGRHNEYLNKRCLISCLQQILKFLDQKKGNSIKSFGIFKVRYLLPAIIVISSPGLHKHSYAIYYHVWTRSGRYLLPLE